MKDWIKKPIVEEDEMVNKVKNCKKQKTIKDAKNVLQK